MHGANYRRVKLGYVSTEKIVISVDIKFQGKRHWYSYTLYYFIKLVHAAFICDYIQNTTFTSDKEMNILKCKQNDRLSLCHHTQEIETIL